ncbi:MAG: efflux RND transporter periplasmic adaptor subunit [Aphanocapsa sp. GSE-SYN-MK-11-07L]|jgi:RND family efflux transporter MFP subunit|nr:efflux RND transporter periplasmic adaptor subunit [Aphanocapsa sp. GSE-SYN-MK-11-07L]
MHKADQSGLGSLDMLKRLGGIGLVLMLIGCGKPEAARQAQSLPVKLQQVGTSALEDSTEFVGSLEALKKVELRSQINGRIAKIAVGFGQQVQPGAMLFQLEPDQTAPQLASAIAQFRAAQANVRTSQANLNKTVADRAAVASNLQLQKVNYERAKTLVAQGAVAQVQLDTETRNLESTAAQLRAQDMAIKAAQAAVNQAIAELRNTEAAVGTANVPFQFKQVRSPIAGTIGNFEVKVGDVVGTEQILTTITQDNFFDLKILVPITRSAQLERGTPVELLDANTNQLLTRGNIYFISPVVTSSAQTILTRARFPNSNGQLRDSQYVRARVIWSRRPGVLVPVTAVTQVSGQNFAFVAQRSACQAGEPPPSTSQIVCQRLVQLGAIQGQNYQVLEGLKSGDQIAISNIINLRNGAPIKPES